MLNISAKSVCPRFQFQSMSHGAFFQKCNAEDIFSVLHQSVNSYSESSSKGCTKQRSRETRPVMHCRSVQLSSLSVCFSFCLDQVSRHPPQTCQLWLRRTPFQCRRLMQFLARLGCRCLELACGSLCQTDMS